MNLSLMKLPTVAIKTLLTGLLLLTAATSAFAAKRPLKVLAIGNSFTVDAVQDDLVPLAAADSIDLVVGYPYRPGTLLKEHLNFLSGDSAVYTYRKATPAGAEPYRKHSTMKQAIADENWDWVIIQTNHTGGYDFDEEYLPYFDRLRDSISRYLTNPEKVKWGLYMTWAYDKDSKYRFFKHYDYDQARMFDNIVETTPRLLASTNVDLLIPAGTAIQNLRTSAAFGDRMNRDGYHMNLDHGRYTVACAWLEALTGRPVVGNSYHPKELTAYKARLCQDAAHKAIEKPFEVSDMDIAKLPVPENMTNPLVLGNKRITLITPTLFRLEYAREGRFLDDPTMFAINRDSMLREGYTIEALDGGRRYKIDTGKLQLVFDNDNLPFGQINTEVYFTRMGEEKKISARNLHSKKRNLNLGGSIATLDAVHGEVPLDDGLLSEDGWYYLVDTDSEVLRNGWFERRDPSHVQDQYCFVYGDDFHTPFRDLGVISGKVPMTRKNVHGIWYSRWYPYTTGYVDTLVAEYRSEGFPLDNVVMDMDWHTVDPVEYGIGHNFTKGWTGYTWNRNLIPDPKDLIDRLHADSLYVSVNEHPHDGIRPHEDCYEAFMRDMGYDPAGGETLIFDASDPVYMDRFLHHSRKENKDLGVDFYWLDWQQDYLYPWVPGSKMRHVKWLNKLFYEDLERDNTRGISYSRWGGWGDHRYPINFSGDATGNWDVLGFEVKLSQTGGNGGCYFWVHDTGGFHGIYDPELHVRWSQFGALTAALRVHASRGKGLDRRPWLWGEQATEGMHSAYTFRSQAMPYIYSSIRRTHESMLPLNRCMFVDYPTDSAAYNRYGQYLFGDILLASPIVKPGKGERKEASVEVWFPADAPWYDYFTDEMHAAGATDMVTKDISTFPLFVKGGQVLPLQPFSHRPASAPLDNLIMRIYPGVDGESNTFTLYEDDGISLDYQKGGYAKTDLTYTQNNGKATVTVAPTAGEYNGQTTSRSYTLELGGYAAVKDVRVDGRKAKATLRDGRYYVEVPSRSVRKGLKVTFDFTPGAADNILAINNK